jgi:uncharacterized protein YjbI with pentapeptide repeats
VVSLSALVVALGGTALASSYVITSSSQIKDGSVASADVKNASLTGADLKDGSVATADVKNSSLTGADIKDRSLSPSDFSGSVAGPKGDPGPQGPVGPKGETGPPGPSDAYTGYSESGTLSSSDTPTTLVAGTSIPGGDYVFQANLVLTNTANTGVAVSCQIFHAGTVDVAITTLDAAGGLDTQTLSLAGTGTAEFDSGNYVYLLCSGPVDYDDADIIATRVGFLH